MTDEPREFTPAEIEALRKHAAEIQEALTKRMAPIVETMREVSDAQIAQLGESVRAAAEAVRMPALEAARQITKELSEIKLPTMGMPEFLPSEAITALPMPTPPEAYIVDAIRGTGEVLNASLEIQRTQAEEISKMRQSLDHQTVLTRWVLGVAVATALATGLGIAATVLVALFLV